jgi:DNA-binding GntR family transcriptional regulator
MEKLASERHNVDAVHDRLRGAILRGEIPPGEVLQQVPLAEEPGVSRTPLREAFRLLQREGLLEGSPNRSYRVTSFSPRDLEELYVTFIPLQALAIRLTIPRMQSADIAMMMGDLAQMDHYAEAQDVEGWEQPHREFHHRLIQHAGRRVVELLESCRAGNANLASGQLSRHLAHTALDVLAMADEAFEPQALKVALAVAQLPLPDEV